MVIVRIMEIEELLLGSNQSNQTTLSVCAWNYSTGNAEQVYKNGGTALTQSLCLLDNNYILTANQDTPLLHIWPINSQEQLKKFQCVMPDIVRCLDVDNSNNYLIAGIGIKIYVWHLSSGKLLNILQKHYQPISRVKFSSDSAYTIATGTDGMLVVYKLDDIVCTTNSYTRQRSVGECEPLYTKMDSSVITDLAIGNFKSKSKIATCSIDTTCRIYMLQTGEQLLTLVFKQALTSVLFDSTSWNIYIGDIEGLISRITLNNPPRMLEHHVDLAKTDTFTGHKKKITCLAINYTNEILASGADDFNIIIWDIANKNVLRTIERIGTITNLKFVLKHENFGAHVLKPTVFISPLQRTVSANMTHFFLMGKSSKINFEDGDNQEYEEIENEVSNDSQAEIKKLKFLNKEMYDAFIKMTKIYDIK